ncbi:MAG: hypothetical protein AAF171_27095 [Cyanobacteria bacterium P01_A01_bin.116]
MGKVEKEKTPHEYALRDTEEPLQRSQQPPKRASNQARSLSYEQTYRCPACGSGDLSAIALMDVFGCDFCRHLFTANLNTQTLQLADEQRPRAWQWTGERWRTRQQSHASTPVLWTFTTGLTLTPVLLIALSNYIFPPLDGSNFPVVWSLLTLMSHSAISAWLLAEYYRWPWYVSSRIRWQRLREHLQEKWLVAESGQH